MTTNSAPPDLRRLIGALEKFGLDLAGVPGDTDPDAFADLVEVAARNWKAGRVRAARHLWRHFRVKATMRMSVRAWDEAQHPRGQPENAGEFAPKGAAAPAPKPKRPARPKKPHVSGIRRTRAPSVKEAHAAVSRAEADRDRVSAQADAAQADHGKLVDRYEKARGAARTADDWAVIEHLRGQVETSKQHVRDLLARHAAAAARVRRAFLRTAAARVKSPARLTRSAKAHGHPLAFELPTVNAAHQQVLDDAHSFVAAVCHWPGGGPPPYRPGVSKDGRAFFANGPGGQPSPEPVVALPIDYLSLTEGAGEHERAQVTKVHLHELGHMIEMRKPGVLAKARAFLAERTAGETPVALAGLFPNYSFAADETGRKDDFAKAFDPFDEGKPEPYYAGKEYGNGMTELVSMGLELLFDDPGHFARADPEYYRWLLTVLTT